MIHTPEQKCTIKLDANRRKTTKGEELDQIAFLGTGCKIVCLHVRAFYEQSVSKKNTRTRASLVIFIARQPAGTQDEVHQGTRAESSVTFTQVEIFFLNLKD